MHRTLNRFAICRIPWFTCKSWVFGKILVQPSASQATMEDTHFIYGARVSFGFCNLRKQATHTIKTLRQRNDWRRCTCKFAERKMKRLSSHWNCLAIRRYKTKNRRRSVTQLHCTRFLITTNAAQFISAWPSPLAQSATQPYTFIWRAAVYFICIHNRWWWFRVYCRIEFRIVTRSGPVVCPFTSLFRHFGRAKNQ